VSHLLGVEVGRRLVDQVDVGGFAFAVWGSGFRVWGLGFEVGFRVSGFKV